MSRAEEAALKAYPEDWFVEPALWGLVANPPERDFNAEKRSIYQKGYEAAQKDLGWISIKERLPEKPGRYYTATKYEEYGIHSFVVNNWFDDEGYIVVVDYWMPIPELPKK